MENLKVWLDGSLIYTFPSQHANIAVKTVITLRVPQAAKNVTLSRDDQHPGQASGYTFIRFCEVQVWGTCKRGYYGPDCDQPCAAVTGPHCMRDVCNPDNGSCVCNNGLVNPPFCRGCPVGRYDTDCKPCGQCKGGPTACNISTGHCTDGCLPGWKPPLCQDACSQGSFGTNCAKDCGQGCSTNCTYPRQPNCRFCNHVNGDCECRDNWTNGFYRPCSVCAPGRYNRSSDCRMQCGKCGNGQTCNSSTGHCSSCQGRFVMPLCQHDCPVNRYGDDCSKVCSWGCKETCPSPSSAYCLVCDHVTGACPCRTGWTNSSSGYCTECGPGYYNMSSDCSMRCGQCASQSCDVITGRCKSCQPGFLLPLCQQACPDGYYGEDCSEKCGHCLDDQPCNKSTGYCPLCATGNISDKLCKTVCSDGTYGQNCSATCGKCWGGAPCEKITGVCPMSLAHGQRCEDGFKGETCHVSEMQEKSESRDMVSGSLVGPIVGSIIGAGALIAIGVIAAQWMKQRNMKVEDSKGSKIIPVDEHLNIYECTGDQNPDISVPGTASLSTTTSPTSLQEPTSDQPCSVYEIVPDNTYDALHPYSNAEHTDVDVYTQLHQDNN